MSDFENIPEKLQERDQWLLWDSSADTPRRPHWRGKFSVSWSDPEEWHSFEMAVEAANERDSWGIGYVTAASEKSNYDAGEYGVIDIDGAADEDDHPKDWVPSLQPFFDHEAYIEWSPSHGEAGDSGQHIPIAGIEIPQWWSDSQLDDHEGIDVLANKFCTFTGDTLCGSDTDSIAEWDEWVADWLAEAYKGITNEEPRQSEDNTTQTPYAADHPNQSSSGDYGDITREEIEELLAALPGNQHWEQWMRTGYAVFSWDETETGKDVFEQWSRSNSKWEEEDSQREIDYIWENGDADGEAEENVSVATLIKYAREHGYDSDIGTSHPSAALNPDDTDLPTPADFTVSNGGYHKFHPPKNGDDRGWYEQITNFQIEVLSRLTHEDETREFHLQIHPEYGDPYDVTVEPVVFNELRKFRREVLEGWSVTFDGGQGDLNDLKQFAATQPAPDRRGTDQIGLHGDEFVTPEGSLTAEGWTDEPDVIYTDESSQLNPLWQLTPEDDPEEIDKDAVVEILKLLPQTRSSDRFLPVLGWFYAAPLRPLIMQWEGEFNLLNVLGDTGAGKTATLEVLWQLFGMDGELLTAETTPFTMLTALSSTNGLPVLLDEYKPADMSERRKDKLHRYLRTSTKGGIESKGNADRSTDNYKLNAPVCLSGEQPIQGPAEERRSIMTTFTRDGVVGDTQQSRAFARLTGGKAGDEYYEGKPLADHAMAYYTWMLEQHEDGSLRKMWRNARDRVVKLLGERDLDVEGLDDMTLQGFQTIWFGCQLYQLFAREVGIDVKATPVTPEAIEDAIEYVAGEGSGADHVSHLDRFVGLLGRASAADYVELGEHYTVVESRTTGNNELRVRLSTAFDQVRRYVRDHDVRGEDLLDSVSDYRARIRDNAENTEGYIGETSQNTHLSNGTQGRCVGIEVKRAAEVVDDFDLEMFVVTDDADDDETEEPITPADLKLESRENNEELPAIRATVAGVWKDKFGNIVGELEGDGDSVDVHFAGCAVRLECPVTEGATYEFRGLRAKRGSGEAHVEHRPTSEYDALELPESPSDGSDGDTATATTDGGEPAAEETEEPVDDDAKSRVNDDSMVSSSVKGQVIEHLRINTAKGDHVTAANVAGQIDENPVAVRDVLTTIVTERSILTRAAGGFEVLAGN